MVTVENAPITERRFEELGSLVPFPRLQALCRPEGSMKPRAASVRKWCDAHGIPYKPDLQGGIWTTVEAINMALGVVVSHEEIMGQRRVRMEDLV